MSQLVCQSVSDKGKQQSDSGPIKIETPGCDGFDKYQVYAQFKTFASEESAIGAETGIQRQIYFGKDQS